VSATATAAAAAPDPVRSRKPATVSVDSWWRGLPARAWTTSLRRNGRTAGRMPTAPWEASSHAWRSQSSLKKKRHANDRNATGETTGTAPVGPATRLTSLRPFSCTAGPENRVLFGAREAAYRRAQQPRLTSGTQGTGCRASAGRSPGEGEPVLFQRCPAPPRATRRTNWGAPAGVQYTVLCRLRSSFDGHNTVWGSPGSGLPEKSVTATKQAVETPEGGRIRPSATNTTRHRRAASRSGGATSAERDGRPVGRRTESRRRLQPQRQGQRQLQQTAPGPVAVTGIRTRARGRSRARSRTKPLLSTKIPSGSVRDRFSGSRQPPPDPATNI
jgi:hypothetical protein